jgi:hypothetical protein
VGRFIRLVAGANDQTALLQIIKLILAVTLVLVSQLISTGTITVNNCGTVKGIGIIDGDVLVNNGGFLELGQSPGFLAVDKLNLTFGALLTSSADIW